MLTIGCKVNTKDRLAGLPDGPLIESNELRDILGKSNLKIIDVRNSEAFDSGHIPGAIRISRTDMESIKDTVPGMRATASQLETLLSNYGIAFDDWLVLYDDRGNPEAARLWCILQGYGKERIKLLNGGLKAWEENGFDLTKEAQAPASGSFRWNKTVSNSLWIDAEEIAQKLRDTASNLVLIDTRTAEEYHGVRQKKNAERAGHIPGALHLDWADLMDFHGDHRLKQKNEIRSIMTKFGLSKRDSIVVYCHSGVRSSLSTFVLREVMEYPNVWNYDGSWTEWSRLKQYPIEVDSVTTIFN